MDINVNLNMITASQTFPHPKSFFPLVILSSIKSKIDNSATEAPFDKY